MKTEYKPIAMRCTQEQFNSIKDRITLPIENIGSFDTYPYLINFHGEQKAVSNGLFYGGTETHETFNGELFLDCCGREKDDFTTDCNPYGDSIGTTGIHQSIINQFSLRMESNKCEYKLWYANKLNKKVSELDEYDLHCVNVIKEYIKDKVWLRNELQFELDGKWYDSSQEYKIRVKTHPDYTAEIEALKNKAKENGKKVIIKFEEL
jgi:hypothetical protein